MIVRLAPQGGPAIESGGEVGLASIELGLEHLPEQMVVTEPTAVVVQGDDEEVVVLEPLQYPRRVVVLEHEVAKRPRHPLEYRTPKQELELGRPDACELFGAQIIRHEAIVAAERRERRGVGVERERREIDTRRPALRMLVQRLGLVLGHVGSRRGEERVRFGIAECEGGGAYLEQLAGGTELREPEPSLRTAGEDQL